jgi:hypothetical protein
MNLVYGPVPASRAANVACWTCRVARARRLIVLELKASADLHLPIEA